MMSEGLDILQILCNIVNINENGKRDNAKYADYPLTGDIFQMSGMDLYRFLMVIENTFEIYFSVDDIIRGNFRTLRAIEAEIKQMMFNSYNLT